MSVNFKIIIPNYNNAEWIDNCLNSIYIQSFSDYAVIFVDDCSTDDSVKIVENWRLKFKTNGNDLVVLQVTQKEWNGGARNIGMGNFYGTFNPYFSGTRYTLFLDSDDWFSDGDCLKTIADALEQNNYPDLLRLSYCVLVDDHLTTVDMSDQKTIERIVSDQNVACWTKCVKTEKLVPFPENTLMEDVVQHIKQLDNVETVASISKGIVVWNRNNKNSCSRDETLQNGKWKSSLYRYYADLLDLEVNKPECKAELERRRKITLENIKNDRFVQ